MRRKIQRQLCWTLLGASFALFPAFYRDSKTPVRLDAHWSFQTPFDGTIASVPQRLRELDGRHVVITGFWYPREFGPKGAVSAELHPEKAGSFNHVAVEQRIFVAPANGIPATILSEPESDSEVDVSGTFHVRLVTDPMTGSPLSLYSIDADGVGPPWTIPLPGPAWITAIRFAGGGIIGAVAVLALVRKIPSRRVWVPGRCPTCGYDLRATPGQCPECGTAAVLKITAK